MKLLFNTVYLASFVELNQVIEGTICPQDVDIFGYSLEADARIEVRLEHMSSQSDLAIDILDADGRVVASADTIGRM